MFVSSILPFMIFGMNKLFSVASIAALSRYFEPLLFWILTLLGFPILSIMISKIVTPSSPISRDFSGYFGDFIGIIGWAFLMLSKTPCFSGSLNFNAI